MELQAPAALAGQIIGTSLSPEMWAAVAAVIYFARSSRAFVVALMIAATVLLAVRFAMIPAYQPMAVMSAVLALVIWSSIGWGIREMIKRRKLATGSKLGGDMRAPAWPAATVRALWRAWLANWKFILCFLLACYVGVSLAGMLDRSWIRVFIR